MDTLLKKIKRIQISGIYILFKPLMGKKYLFIGNIFQNKPKNTKSNIETQE